jgi:hypothetical protein
MAITVQSSYSTSIAAGFAGMVMNGEESNRISRTIEDSAGIAFGKAAFRGSGDHGVTLTPAAATFMGIVIADSGQVPASGETADTVAQYGTVGLLIEGVIYVSASVAVADGDQAYVTSAGLITNVSTSNTAIPAKFDATTGAAGIVPLRVFSDRT